MCGILRTLKDDKSLSLSSVYSIKLHPITFNQAHSIISLCSSKSDVCQNWELRPKTVFIFKIIIIFALTFP